MRHLVDILRLKHQHQLSVRDIARSCALASSTVGDYLARAEAAQLGWPLPNGLSEAGLQIRLFQQDPRRSICGSKAGGLDHGAHPRP